MGPQKQLNSYVKRVKDTPFKWGHHDCLTFTNGAWRSMYGRGWADDWLGRYMVETSYGERPMRGDQLRNEFGFFSFIEAVDEKLTRVDCVPPRGALVVTDKAEKWGIGYGMGISMGIKAAFLSRKGVIYMPVTDIAKAWI
jgi:hypothetical protein